MAVAPNGGKGFGKKGSGERVRVSKRLTGKLVEWKGTWGWIKSNEPVNMPEAIKQKGKLFFMAGDVEEDLPALGCPLTFIAYTDGTGLGAMHVRSNSFATSVQKFIDKRSGVGAGAPAGKGAAGRGAASKGAAGKGAALPGFEGRQALQSRAFGSPADHFYRERPAPDKEAREVVLGAPIAGTVRSVRGQVAYIEPDDTITHPDAAKCQGQIYLHLSDLDDGQQQPLIGAKVVFFVYCDLNGLGAHYCQIAEQGSGEAQGGIAPDGTALGSAAQAAARAAAQAAQHRAKGQAQAPAGKGAGKRERPKGPSGPSLPRVLLGPPVLGTVDVWREGRHVGWIKPDEPVRHPLAAKRKGNVYLHLKDIVGGAALAAGARVRFRVFADTSGLGAQECHAL